MTLRPPAAIGKAIARGGTIPVLALITILCLLATAARAERVALSLPQPAFALEPALEQFVDSDGA